MGYFKQPDPSRISRVLREFQRPLGATRVPCSTCLVTEGSHHHVARAQAAAPFSWQNCTTGGGRLGE